MLITGQARLVDRRDLGAACADLTGWYSPPPAGPPPPPPPPPPGTLGKKRPENVDANAGGKDGPTPNCVVLRSPTSQRPRSAGAAGLEGAAATAEQKRRLKQLHWDKLKQAREGTVWTRANRDKLHLDLAQLESLFQVGAGGCGWRGLGVRDGASGWLVGSGWAAAGGVASMSGCSVGSRRPPTWPACLLLSRAPTTSTAHSHRSWRPRPSSAAGPKTTRCACPPGGPAALQLQHAPAAMLPCPGRFPTRRLRWAGLAPCT